MELPPTIDKKTKFGNIKSVPYHLTTVKISPEFYKLCKRHAIQWSEAMRVGISIILAERGVADYDNRLTIVRRLNKAVEQLSATSQELHTLKEKLQ